MAKYCNCYWDSVHYPARRCLLLKWIEIFWLNQKFLPQNLSSQWIQKWNRERFSKLNWKNKNRFFVVLGIIFGVASWRRIIFLYSACILRELIYCEGWCWTLNFCIWSVGCRCHPNITNILRLNIKSFLKKCFMFYWVGVELWTSVFDLLAAAAILTLQIFWGWTLKVF